MYVYEPLRIVREMNGTVEIHGYGFDGPDGIRKALIEFDALVPNAVVDSFHFKAETGRVEIWGRLIE